MLRHARHAENEQTIEYKGYCHCGCIEVCLHTTRGPAALGARSCQCSFCRMHGASWTSDPEGRLDIRIGGDGGTHRYRLGTGSAEFLVCTTCGVVPAVTWRSEVTLLGVVRVECLADRDALLAHARQTDFDDEDLARRLARRSRSWTPATESIAG